MNWAQHVQKLREGETVSFRPKGNSMQPRIESGNLVTVSPDTSGLKPGDVAFCKVRGRYYVHLVLAEKTEGGAKFYQIGNNKGHVNGWVNQTNVYGRVVQVAE